MMKDMVRDRADGKRMLLCPRRIHIERRRFHLHGKNAHLLPAVICLPALGHIAVVAVEPVGGQDVADVVRNAHFLSRLDAGLQHVEVCNRGKRACQMVLRRPVGVGAGALTDDDVAQLDRVLQRAGGADTHDVLHAEHGVKLPGIDADRRHAHAGCHDGDFRAAVGSGVALNAADIVDQNRVLQEVFRDELCAQRVAGHQHRLTEIAGLCVNVRGRIICHGAFSFVFMIPIYYIL